MKIIGIDPGMASTGVAIVNGNVRGAARGDAGQVQGYSFGTITTSSKTPTSERLIKIYDEIRAIIQAEKPDLMVVEDIFSLGKYPKSGITLGKVTGVILLAGAHSRIPVQEIAVRETKKILTGSGSADKKQLERAVRRHLGRTEPISPSHASDALALALIGLYRGGNRLDRIS